MSECPNRTTQTQHKKGSYGTEYSQAVTHPSTNSAQCCLTTVIGRELVLSTWCGRSCQCKPTGTAALNFFSGRVLKNGELLVRFVSLRWRWGSSENGGRIHQILVKLFPRATKMYKKKREKMTLLQARLTISQDLPHRRAIQSAASARAGPEKW